MSLIKIRKPNYRKGFTIVELLIVIVVVAILAGIVIVSYNGIQNRASDARRAQAAGSVIRLMQNYHTVNGFFPTDIRCVGSASHYPATSDFASGECYKEVTRSSGAISNRVSVGATTITPMADGNVVVLPDGSHAPITLDLGNGRDAYIRGIIIRLDGGSGEQSQNLYIYHSNDNYTCPAGGVKTVMIAPASMCRVPLKKN